ncbi:MAG TPA: SDR family oxidoreductase [Chitinophagales bacterium]|nr:SDR family oxidoreductase [Chitinophagales bacterium]
MNIIITGASKGIGKALALKFAENGHHLAICARSLEPLEELEKELLNISPDSQVISMTADVSVKSEVKKFADKILESWNKIDIIINNAGFFIPGAIKDEDDENLPKMINTNLYSAYYLTKFLLPSMIESKSGHIFNICSIASFTAYPQGGSYAISKFAMLGFSKCLREELKPHNIKVTAVMPGATLTDSWKGVELPEERFIPAEDIASIIYNTTLLSDRTVVEDIVIRPQLGDL